MGSTFSSLRAHIVFSTQERRPFIRDNWRSDLHGYLGNTTRGLNAIPESIGGVVDHVQLLASYGSTMALADFVRKLKKASSVWVAENHESAFRWQEGSSAFSVSASQCQRVAEAARRRSSGSGRISRLRKSIIVSSRFGRSLSHC
jgi:putative transposase